MSAVTARRLPRLIKPSMNRDAPTPANQTSLASGGDPPRRAELVPVSVVFGDVVQIFHVGAASVGTYGCPTGICAAHAQFASLPLTELVAPALRMARDGVALNARQVDILELLSPIIASSPEACALHAKTPPREGAVLRLPDVAEGLELLRR